ncbi:hypothetical protein M8494_31495 [Serratia ureilytica]
MRSALINNGFTFPARRITVNLAPADLPKEGGRYDLPIALAILAASEQLPLAPLARYEFLGELALSGSLRAVRGAIPAALAAAMPARQLILSTDNAAEVGLIAQSHSHTARHLLKSVPFCSARANCRWRPRLPLRTPPATAPICAISSARSKPSGHWRSPPLAGITYC